MSSVREGHVVQLASDLWTETIDRLVESGVSCAEAEAFADKVRWEIEGLLDFVE